MKKTIITYIFLMLTVCISAQQLSLNEIFNNGMVLQQKTAALVWGTAKPTANLSIKIQQKIFKSTSLPDGNWTVTLKNLQPGGPFRMSVYADKDSVVLNEVYVGEVWIAGGQSNMGWTLEKSDGGKEEIANAKNTNIRFVMVPAVLYEGDRTRGDMNWRTATTENVSQISGVAYYFAKELQAKLKVPVGILCCYKGGTAAEVWMSRETLLQNPDHAPIVEAYEKYLADLGAAKMEEINSTYDKNLKIYFKKLY